MVEIQRAKKAAAMERFADKADDAVKIKKMAEYLKTAKERGYARGWCWGRYSAVFKESPTPAIIKAAYASCNVR